MTNDPKCAEGILNTGTGSCHGRHPDVPTGLMAMGNAKELATQIAGRLAVEFQEKGVSPLVLGLAKQLEGYLVSILYGLRVTQTPVEVVPPLSEIEEEMRTRYNGRVSGDPSISLDVFQLAMALAYRKVAIMFGVDAVEKAFSVLMEEPELFTKGA